MHGLDLVAQSDTTTTEYFGYDGLGSVRQVFDAAGDPVMAQTFDPYGSRYGYAGPESVTSVGYTGEFEDGNGLLFLRARFYNPALGRFLNTDPSRQEMNPYGYVNGNPVMSIDPSGLALCLGPALLTPRSNDCWPVYSDEMTPVYIWPAVQAGDEARMTVWEIVANLNDCSDNDDTVATQPDAPYIPTATPLDPTPTPTQPAVQPTSTQLPPTATSTPFYPIFGGAHWEAAGYGYNVAVPGVTNPGGCINNLHCGIDIRPVDTGIDTVYSVTAGHVSYKGTNQVSVNVELPDYPTLQIQYVHVVPAPSITQNTEIQMGDVIGTIDGNDPSANRVYHLHFAVINLGFEAVANPTDPSQNNGRYLDPHPFLYPSAGG